MKEFIGAIVALLLLPAVYGEQGAEPPLEIDLSVDSIQFQTQEAAEPTLLYFPDYVEGAGWSVQLVLSNVDRVQTASVEVEVYDQQGRPAPGFFESENHIEIPSLGSQVLQSSGAGSLRRGWIQVQISADSVRGLLTYRHSQTGVEVGVEPVPLGKRFALFVEESSEIGTGLALFNPDPEAEIEFHIRDHAGRDAAKEVLTWGDFRQRARTIPEWFEGIGQEFLRDFRGLLFLRAADDASFAPIGLRFGKQKGSLSAVPVVPILSSQQIATIVPADPSFGPTEAGKQAQDPFVITINDELGMPVSGATYRWETNENSGWVYPPEGVTDTDGGIKAKWVAGWPGVSSMTLTVANAVSELTVEVATESVSSRQPPGGAINLHMRSEASTGYSIDLTPLAEPAYTYYCAIQWDGGYTGLQRTGSRYDRQLQFSVWDAEGIDAQVIERGEGVICKSFGGEGTGQACELNYPWRVGNTYRFEVTEKELNGGSLMTLHVTDLASGRRAFVGALRFGRRANLSWMNSFVEAFISTEPTCLAQPVRSAAIRRAMARIGGSWQPITSGVLSPHREDSANPGTPACANLAARDHAAGLEVVMGGLTAGGPLAEREVSIPGGESHH